MVLGHAVAPRNLPVRELSPSEIGFHGLPDGRIVWLHWILAGAQLASPQRGKNLRRQSELSGLAFQVGQIGVGVSAKAALEGSGVASQVEASTDALPADAIDARQ